MVNSAQTKQTPEKDKIAHSERGQLRPFPSGFPVNIDRVRGLLVIIPFFYYFPRLTAGASYGRDSSARLSRAIEEARAASSRRQKLHIPRQNDAPDGHLSSFSARSGNRWPVKRRWTVCWRLLLSSLLPPQTLIRSPKCVLSSFSSLKFGFLISLPFL